MGGSELALRGAYLPPGEIYHTQQQCIDNSSFSIYSHKQCIYASPHDIVKQSSCHSGKETFQLRVLMQKMTQGSNGSSRTRPASSASSASSGSGSSKHVKCIGRYVLTGTTLGKGNFARVEAAVHTLTRSKVTGHM